MPIQTVVASLVAIYLRDEMTSLHKELDVLQERADKIEPKQRPGFQIIYRRTLSDNTVYIHSVEIDNSYDNGPYTNTFWIELQSKMRDIEFELNQDADAYNNLLILVRMCANPEYCPTLKSERYAICTRKGRIIE